MLRRKGECSIEYYKNVIALGVEIFQYQQTSSINLEKPLKPRVFCYPFGQISADREIWKCCNSEN